MRQMPIETPQLFAELYTAFQAGERGLTGVRCLRSAARVYDALDAVSAEVKSPAGAVVGRTLAEGGAALRLETAEWELFRDTVRRVAEDGVQGAGRILDARRSLALLDALEGATDVQPTTAASNKPDVPEPASSGTLP